MGLLETMRTRLGEGLLGRQVSTLREQVRQGNDSIELLEEGMADLEMALDDVEWMRLGASSQREFSRSGLRKIAGLARMMYIKNPLIQRGVNVVKFYVWGQGINIRAKNREINQVIQDFLDDERNQMELTSQEALEQKQVEEETDGNLFFVFFVDKISSGRVRLGSIPFDEIEEIISNPEDAKEPWFYKRVWSEQPFRLGFQRGQVETKTAWYPDWRFRPVSNKILSIDGKPVNWDMPVYHVKVGGFSNWKFGVPKVYAAIDWGRAYKEFLEDVATLMRAYSRFAWRIVTKSGKKGLEKAKVKLATTVGSGPGERNPAPGVGSMFIGGEGQSLTPMNVRGASVSPDDGRRLLLMVAASAGLPESFYGDVSVGTLATAKSLDRPTELMMRSIQTHWKGVLSKILEYVVVEAVRAPNGPLHSAAALRVEIENDRRVEKIEWKVEGEKGDEKLDTKIDIDFPPLIEEDVKARVDALVAAATLTGSQLIPDKDMSRMLLNALGEDEIDEILEILYPDDGSAEPAIDSSKDPATFAQAVELRRQLTEVIDKWKEQHA
jgi:hypothetical protein